MLIFIFIPEENYLEFKAKSILLSFAARIKWIEREDYGFFMWTNSCASLWHTDMGDVPLTPQGIRTSEHRLIALLYVPTQTPINFCALGLTSMSTYSKRSPPENGYRADRNQNMCCGTFRVLTALQCYLFRQMCCWHGDKMPSDFLFIGRAT